MNWRMAVYPVVSLLIGGLLLIRDVERQRRERPLLYIPPDQLIFRWLEHMAYWPLEVIAELIDAVRGVHYDPYDEDD